MSGFPGGQPPEKPDRSQNGDEQQEKSIPRKINKLDPNSDQDQPSCSRSRNPCRKSERNLQKNESQRKTDSDIIQLNTASNKTKIPEKVLTINESRQIISGAAFQRSNYLTRKETHFQTDDQRVGVNEPIDLTDQRVDINEFLASVTSRLHILKPPSSPNRDDFFKYTIYNSFSEIFCVERHRSLMSNYLGLIESDFPTPRRNIRPDDAKSMRIRMVDTDNQATYIISEYDFPIANEASVRTLTNLRTLQNSVESNVLLPENKRRDAILYDKSVQTDTPKINTRDIGICTIVDSIILNKGKYFRNIEAKHTEESEQLTELSDLNQHKSKKYSASQLYRSEEDNVYASTEFVLPKRINQSTRQYERLHSGSLLDDQSSRRYLKTRRRDTDIAEFNEPTEIDEEQERQLDAEQVRKGRKYLESTEELDREPGRSGYIERERERNERQKEKRQVYSERSGDQSLQSMESKDYKATGKLRQVKETVKHIDKESNDVLSCLNSRVDQSRRSNLKHQSSHDRPKRMDRSDLSVLFNIDSSSSYRQTSQKSKVIKKRTKPDYNIKDGELLGPIGRTLSEALVHIQKKYSNTNTIVHIKEPQLFKDDLIELMRPHSSIHSRKIDLLDRGQGPRRMDVDFRDVILPKRYWDTPKTPELHEKAAMEKKQALIRFVKNIACCTCCVPFLVGACLCFQCDKILAPCLEEPPPQMPSFVSGTSLTSIRDDSKSSKRTTCSILPLKARFT